MVPARPHCSGFSTIVKCGRFSDTTGPAGTQRSASISGQWHSVFDPSLSQHLSISCGQVAPHNGQFMGVVRTIEKARGSLTWLARENPMWMRGHVWRCGPTYKIQPGYKTVALLLMEWHGEPLMLIANWWRQLLKMWLPEWNMHHFKATSGAKAMTRTTALQHPEAWRSAKTSIYRSNFALPVV